MKQVKHGAARYKNHGCRCDVCRAARSKESRRYRKANREAVARHRLRHPEKVAGWQHRYYEANREMLMAQRKGYRSARRAELINQLGGKCVQCGVTEGLEFDHIDPDIKSERLKGSGRMSIVSLPTEEGRAEMARCQLLCKKPCHREKTAKERRQGRTKI